MLSPLRECNKRSLRVEVQVKSQGPGFDGDTKGLAEGVLGGAQPGSATGLGCSPVLCVIPSLPAQALGAEAAGTTSSAGCVYTCGCCSEGWVLPGGQLLCEE